MHINRVNIIIKQDVIRTRLERYFCSTSPRTESFHGIATKIGFLTPSLKYFTGEKQITHFSEVI